LKAARAASVSVKDPHFDVGNGKTGDGTPACFSLDYIGSKAR
jgi:hypothetical protein